MTTLHGYDINIHPDVWRRSWRMSRRYPQRLLEISRDSRVQFIAVSESIKQRALAASLQAPVQFLGAAPHSRVNEEMEQARI